MGVGSDLLYTVCQNKRLFVPVMGAVTVLASSALFVSLGHKAADVKTSFDAAEQEIAKRGDGNVDDVVELLKKRRVDMGRVVRPVVAATPNQQEPQP